MEQFSDLILYPDFMDVGNFFGCDVQGVVDMMDFVQEHTVESQL